jgi:hypothetical protein
VNVNNGGLPAIETPMSVVGTFETCRLRRQMSEFEVQSGKHILVLSSSPFDPSRKSALVQKRPDMF